jgi:hypothetical protein
VGRASNRKKTRRREALCQAARRRRRVTQESRADARRQQALLAVAAAREAIERLAAAPREQQAPPYRAWGIKTINGEAMRSPGELASHLSRVGVSELVENRRGLLPGGSRPHVVLGRFVDVAGPVQRYGLVIAVPDQHG